MIKFLETNKVVVRLVLILVYLLILSLPGYVFFTQRSGIDFLQASNYKIFASHIFPLFGLYAFTLVWFQTIIGMNMNLFTKIFNKILNFHRYQGLFALLFASTHALAIPYIYGLQQYIGYKFLDSDLRIFAFIGTTAFFLLLLTVATTLLRRNPVLRKLWRYVHYFNYVIFLLVLVHSRNLGSDIQGTILSKLWYFYLAIFLISFVFRLRRNFTVSKAVNPSPL